VGRRSPIPAEIVYLAAFVVAELVAIGRPVVGAVIDAGLVVALVNHYVLSERQRGRPLLLGLAVVCLYRVLALTPLSTNGFNNHLILVGAPALLATILALRVARTTVARPARRRGSVELQILIALSGLPLSIAAFKLLKPTFTVPFPGAGQPTPPQVWVAVVALALFSGVGEELLFRRLIHGAALSTFGRSALYFSTAVFGAAYLGTGPDAYVLFAIAIGAFFGWCYEKTGSIVGVAIAHAFISVGVFVVWPSLPRLIHA
jgi:membrane protease YdiL (CAAX protease family)